MKLKIGEIFVFGSNKSGIHGAGAARYAHDKLGAVWGVGEGRTGTCYALPTKGLNISFMSLDEVKQSVERFIYHANENPETDFVVTQVGCGLGGFTKDQIAPMFEGAPANCSFDSAWQPILGAKFSYWGTY